MKLMGIKRLIAATLIFLIGSIQAQINVDSVRDTTFDYACLDGNLNIISSHQRHDKAVASCLTRKLADPGGIYYVQGGRWRIDVTGAQAQISPLGGSDDTNPPPDPPGNSAPVWLDTPVVNFTEGVASSVDMIPDFLFDSDGDTLTLADGGGCTLPTGVTVDDPNDQVDASTGTTAGTTTGCTLTADDGTASAVTSPAFPITIAAASGGAGYEDIISEQTGFAATFNAGAGVGGGVGGILVTVTNLNNSGAGSLRAAIDAGGSRWIRFAKGLTGNISLSSVLNMDSDNVTLDGRGANVTINSQSLSRAISINGDNLILTYLKFDANVILDTNDLIVQFAPAEGLWIHKCTFTGAGDDQFSTRVSGGTTTRIAYITVSWSKFSGVSSFGPILINAFSSGTGVGSHTRITLHHNDISGGSRGPRTQRALVHLYNNYNHAWTGGYILPGLDAQIYADENYADPGTTQWMKAITSASPRGYVYDAGGNVENGGNIFDDGPANVFDPSSFYSWTPDTANAAMKTDIQANAGWQNVPFPGDP